MGVRVSVELASVSRAGTETLPIGSDAVVIYIAGGLLTAACGITKREADRASATSEAAAKLAVIVITVVSPFSRIDV